MNHRRNAVCLAAWLCLSVCAGAAVKNGAIRITVVDSQTRSVTLDGSGVEKNCDGVNYDAYCHSSKAAEITNLLLVQAGDRAPFWVSCSIETKWSRCTPLPKGESFNARQEKRGLSIYFVDDRGKVRQQLYTYVGDEAKGKSEAVAAAEIPPTPVPPIQAQASRARPSQVQPSQAPAVQDARTSEPPARADEVVKCSFASTPAGAEITVDGKYVGSTPSALSLAVGTHAVEVSLPGFVQWKRELTVSAGSLLSVNAVLEKVQ
ncbi:MAG: PEGA domain-containing protein [Candidatus Sulfotelmatobacter sp.]